MRMAEIWYVAGLTCRQTAFWETLVGEAFVERGGAPAGEFGRGARAQHDALAHRHMGGLWTGRVEGVDEAGSKQGDGHRASVIAPGVGSWQPDAALEQAGPMERVIRS